MNTAYEPVRPGRFWLFFLWTLEVTGILIGASSAFSVTFGNHLPENFIDWFIAAPMVALATIELMRIYLARVFCYHTNILIRLAAVAGLVLCVGVAFENWTIGIERLVNWRYNVIEQRREEVRAVQQKVDDQLTANREREAQRQRGVGEANSTIAKNDDRPPRSMPPPRPGPKSTAGSGRHPRRLPQDRRTPPRAQAGRRAEALRGRLPLREGSRRWRKRGASCRSRRARRATTTSMMRRPRSALQADLAAAERLAREANANVLNRPRRFVLCRPAGSSATSSSSAAAWCSRCSAIAVVPITIGALVYWPKRPQRPSRVGRALRRYLARRRKPGRAP